MKMEIEKIYIDGIQRINRLLKMRKNTKWWQFGKRMIIDAKLSAEIQILAPIERIRMISKNKRVPL